MNTLIGHPIEDAQQRYGVAEQVIDMPDHSKVYQFRTGGLGMITKGCLANFSTRQKDGRWIIESTDLRDRSQC